MCSIMESVFRYISRQRGVAYNLHVATIHSLDLSANTHIAYTHEHRYNYTETQFSFHVSVTDNKALWAVMSFIALALYPSLPY